MSPVPALAPDAAVPQRDLLLNVDEVARRLSARLGVAGPVAIERFERTHVKYRVGESLRVAHRVRVDGASYDVACRTFAPGRSEAAYRRAEPAALPCGSLRPVLHEPELEAVFWTFPNDRRIASLDVLTEPPASLVRALDRRWTETRLVAYVPESAATALCLDRAGRTLAYAKVYADAGEGERTWRLHDALLRRSEADSAHLRLPQAIAYSQAHRTLLVEPIEGRRLSELRGAALEAGMRRLGAALATFHGLPEAGLAGHVRVDVERLRTAADTIGRARPDARALAHDLARALSSRAAESTGPAVCLHGDAHLANAVLCEGRVALIDLDEACSGPAATDLGRVLAGLRYSRRTGHLTGDGERALARALLAGYAMVRELPADGAVRWHTAAALLATRALPAVNKVRAEGLLHLRTLLADAGALVS